MNLAALVRPRPSLSDQDVVQGLRMMTGEGIASLALFSVTTSGLLAAFALALGANNLQIGVLVALPFITQPLQIPALLLVERLRWRKAITLGSWVPAQAMWVLIALIPFFVGVPSRTAVAMLLGFMTIRGLLSAVTNCSWNSWVRDLVPQGMLGNFFSRRLAWATTAAIVFSLASAFFVDWWLGRSSEADRIFGYTYILLVGAIFLGAASPLFIAGIPEPSMQPLSGPQPSLRQMVAMPLRDRNFRQLANFLFSWGFAANLAVPFFTIYMLQRLGFSLSAVIALNTLSQLTMVLFLHVWGLFADRYGSKVVLSLSASLYLLAILGWTFTTQPERYFLTVPLVVLLQIFAGMAAAGVNLATSTIGLKLAPQGEATSYMVVASLATNIGAGLGPLAGGVLADYFSARRFSMNFEWASPTNVIEFPAFHLTGFDFLFTIAVVIGLLTLKTLTTVREEGEVEREVVLEELLAPAREMARTIGVIPGLRFVGGFPYAYLRRVPGVDVALGVTAYQVAASVKTAVSAANHGGGVVAGIAERVSHTVALMVEEAGELGEHGVNLARHAARGAMHSAGGVAHDVGHVARGAVLGALNALGQGGMEPWDAVWEVSYGTVQGAGEIGVNVGQAATQAVEGAKDAAQRLGLSEEEAVSQATQGALAAAVAIGPEAAAIVQEAFRQGGLTGVSYLEPGPADGGTRDALDVT